MKRMSTRRAQQLVLRLALAAALVAAGWPAGASEAAVPLRTQAGGAATCPQIIFVDTGQALGSGNSLSIALGKMNGDATVDVVIGSGAGAGQWEQVWLNTGGGVFSPTATFGENGDTPQISLADVDGDGDQDVIPAGAGSVVFRNDGLGGLSMGQWLNLGFDSAIAVGELDGGGRPEVVLGGDGSTSPAQAWRNIGFAPDHLIRGQSLTLSNTVEILIGDVDGDSDNDLILINDAFPVPQASQVWLNDGAGGFSPGVAFVPGHPEVAAAAIGDVNGDAFPDLVLAFDGAGVPLEVRLNDGAGNFGSGMSMLNPILASDVALGDVDGDSDLDLLVSARSGQAEAWLNDGSGSFCQAQTGIGSRVNALALGDLDNNSSLDVFTGEDGPNQVWLNSLSVSFADSLTLSLSGDTAGGPGQTLSYSAAITNLGPATATNVQVNIGISLYGGYPEAITITTPSTQCWAAGADCPVGDALPGATLAVSIEVKHSAAYDDSFGTVEATTTSDVDDPNPSNNRDFVEFMLTSCYCSLHWLYLDACSGGRPRMAPAAPAGIQAVGDLPVYYRLRDEIMSTTPAGQHYTALYYRHNDEILNLLLADAALWDNGLNTLALWAPALQALAAGQGETAILTQAQVDAMDNFLSRVAALGSPALQADIALERSKLPPLDEFVGLSIAQARNLVVGHAVYLPAIIR